MKRINVVPVRRIGVAGFLALAALNLWAAQGGAPSAAKSKFDVTGTWNATSQDARGPVSTLVFMLKQDGDKLTGTVSTNGSSPVEISEARVLRTSIYFEVSIAPAWPPELLPPGGRAIPTVTTRFTGTPSANEMKLTRQIKGPALPMDAYYVEPMKWAPDGQPYYATAEANYSTTGIAMPSPVATPRGSDSRTGMVASRSQPPAP